MGRLLILLAFDLIPLNHKDELSRHDLIFQQLVLQRYSQLSLQQLLQRIKVRLDGLIDKQFLESSEQKFYISHRFLSEQIQL